jgi:TolA-binding protein
VATKAEPAKTASSPKAAPSKVEPTKSETTGESLRIAGRVAAPIAAPTGDADLAAQTAAYREAHALREREPAAALAKLREIVKRWPRAAIRHEVDLAVIDALVRLGKTGDAKKAARGFIRDYPASARATEIRAIAEAP